MKSIEEIREGIESLEESALHSDAMAKKAMLDLVKQLTEYAYNGDCEGFMGALACNPCRAIRQNVHQRDEALAKASVLRYILGE